MTGRKKHLVTALFLLYLAALLCITVVRPWNGTYRFLGDSVNTKLLVSYRPILQTSLPLFVYLFGGNIVWFVPFGFYLAFFEELRMRRVILYGFLLSVFIEVMQFVLGTGVSEVDDLLLNTLGSALGGLIAACIPKKRAKQRRDIQEK